MTFFPEFGTDKNLQSLNFISQLHPHPSGGFMMIPCMSDLVE